MSIDTGIEPGRRTLSTFDFDLPVLACEAATELDNLLLGREARLDVVNDLVRWLMEEFPDVATEPTGFDPTSVILMNRAFGVASEIVGIPDTVGEVAKAAQRIRRVLEDVVSGGSVEQAQLIQLRTLCVALSKAASAYARPSPWESRRPRKS